MWGGGGGEGAGVKLFCHLPVLNENVTPRPTHTPSIINDSSITVLGAPVAQWVNRWPTDLADQVRVPLEAKSCQPLTGLHYTQPFIINFPSS